MKDRAGMPTLLVKTGIRSFALNRKVMMMFFNRVSQALTNRLVDGGRTRARLELLARSDRFLLDSGFSRELLAQGNDAWPWRVDGILPSAAMTFALPPARLRASVLPVKHSSREHDQAVVELNAMSDAELSDLGIVRAGIREAVRNGRPGENRAQHGAIDRMAA